MRSIPKTRASLDQILLISMTLDRWTIYPFFPCLPFFSQNLITFRLLLQNTLKIQIFTTWSLLCILDILCILCSMVDIHLCKSIFVELEVVYLLRNNHGDKKSKYFKEWRWINMSNSMKNGFNQLYNSFIVTQRNCQRHKLIKS